MKKTAHASIAILSLLLIFTNQTAHSLDAKDAGNSGSDAVTGDGKVDSKVDDKAAGKAEGKEEGKPQDKGESSAKGSDKEQVKAWFAQYDEIRRGAEMTLQEKLQAHSLFSKGLDANSGSKEFDKSAKFAKTMLDRYTEAGGKIKQLTELSATAELQKGYAEFFNTGASTFRDYLQYQKDGGDQKETKAKLLAKKEKLTALVNTIKATDAKLRSKYGVRAHKHS